MKTDSMGDTLWTREYGGQFYEEGYAGVERIGEGYLITGNTSTYGAGWRDIYLIKINQNGDTLWTRTYGDSVDDCGYSIQETEDGGYIIAGETDSYGAGRSDIYLVRIDSLGNIVWTKTIGGVLSEVAWAIQKTSDGGYIIAGCSASFGSGHLDAYLVKLGPDIGVEEFRKEKLKKDHIKIYPNPFCSTLSLKTPYLVKIYDLSGRFIIEVKDNWSGKDSQGQEAPPGIYFLKLNGKPVGKVVKVR